MNEWKSVYRGRAERGDGFVYQYKLKTVAVPDVGAQTPFEYSIHPVSLDIIKRLAHPSHLKVASVMKEIKAAERGEAAASSSPPFIY